MSDVRLLWCHGSLSQPWGNKSLALKRIAHGLGLDMEAPDFSDLADPDERVDRLCGLLAEDGRPAILAGSSMGGYVATAASLRAEVNGLFLLAPAFYFPGYAVHVFYGLPARVTVAHGWGDEVVPVDNALRFARTHRAELHVFDDNHRLEDSIPELSALFAHFLTTTVAAAPLPEQA